MRYLLSVSLCFFVLLSVAQSSKIKADKYPSLLWEIRSPRGAKPSYLFGTMHVSNKMVFHLSDSFYLALRSAQVVALETNPGTWQQDFSRYEMDPENYGRYRRRGSYGQGDAEPSDYLTINTLQLSPYEKAVEQGLYSSPAMINSFLYRSNSEASSDFEEDTYLDLHIFQTGKKLGKKVCGVEDFDGSMQLVKEAYTDAAKEKVKKERSYDNDDDLNFGKLEEAYRTGNLDLLDTINKRNSQSAAFDEKFLYRRNEIQAHAMDSIIKSGATLFVGVGAAHLPGNRGVIELLRRAGYTLRPIKMTAQNSQQKDLIEKIRVPVTFSKQTADDGFYSVQVPGKLMSSGRSADEAAMGQFADMVNGSYYMVSRIPTHAGLIGHTPATVERKIDSVLYENIPGKILSRQAIVRNGYHGFDITNRTRRGDYQRYNIFITPAEVLIFKMSGTADYVRLGTEANRFFSSIQLKETKTGWTKYSPSWGGFEVTLPQQPLVTHNDSWVYETYDSAAKTGYGVIRTDVHNYSFTEQDSFDLNLMEESFGASSYIQRLLSRHPATVAGYAALDAVYKYKDSSVAQVRFIINGTRYYTVVAHGPANDKSLSSFIHSFTIKPLVYATPVAYTDTNLKFTVSSPVPLDKKKKLTMYPDEKDLQGYGKDDDEQLVDEGDYTDKLIATDSTGEKVYVLRYAASAYFTPDSLKKEDSTDVYKQWTIRKHQKQTAADGTETQDYEYGGAKSGRMLKSKAIYKNGIGYRLITELDTLAAPSVFVASVFNSFHPDSLSGNSDFKKSKTALFFSQLFGTDTTARKKAIKNIDQIDFASADLTQLKKAIATLSWKEKQYLDTKKAFLQTLHSMPSNEASDYLKQTYFAAGDTIELQYTALETLLQQQTAYSYKVFGNIMQTDPPVLDVTDDNATDYSVYRRGGRSSVGDGDGFFDELTDSLQLTAAIYPQLLPLININDYEEPVMNLTGTLLDSSLLAPKSYESYLPKFLLEAKQILKKQMIREKAKDIEKAQEDGDDTKNRYDRSRDETDNGNTKLSLYATLLLPYWDKNVQVPVLINQLLQSADKRLKYNTALLLLRNKKPVPDSVLQSFAATDEYRYELYQDLDELHLENRFPAAYKNIEQLSRSRLLNQQSYNKPDTVVYLTKKLLQQGSREGWVYFFKYKDKKEESAWKLAAAGLIPKDEKTPAIAITGKSWQERNELDYTDLSNIKLDSDTPQDEQIEKYLKRLQYGKRKSGAQFYTDASRYTDFNIDRIRY